LQVDSSLYLIDWSQIQQNVYLPHCGNQYVANLGHVQSRGGDISVQYRPVEQLTLGLTASYTDARFTKTACASSALEFNGSTCIGSAAGESAAPVVSQGDRLVGSPWSIFSSAEYAQALALFKGHTGYLRLDYQYTTAQTAQLAFQDPRNALFDTTIPGLPVTRNLQLRTGVRWSGLDLSLFGNNLTNEHPLLFESRDIPALPDNLYYARTTRPRTFGLTATYRY
jgi:outer membrane receptor protein involved in Fe transport